MENTSVVEFTSKNYKYSKILYDDKKVVFLKWNKLKKTHELIESKMISDLSTDQIEAVHRLRNPPWPQTPRKKPRVI